MSYPYIKFSQHWILCPLGELLDQKGKSIIPAKTPDASYELYSVPSFPNSRPEVLLGNEIGSNKQIVATNSVLLCKINPRINRVWVVGNFTNNPKIASTEWIVFPEQEGVCPDFLSYYLKQHLVREFLAHNASGVGGSLMRVKPATIRNFPFAIPPLAEQQRIVTKIEELFSELDKGIETIKTAKAQLAVYRQAILKDAFEGKLTAEWRAAHTDELETAEQMLKNIPQNRKKEIPAITAAESEHLSNLPAEWQYIRLGRLIHSIQAGKSFKCDERCPLPHEVGVAKVSAVTWGEYQEKESKTCLDNKKVIPSYFICEGDFLLSRANTIDLVGACVIVKRITQRIMLSDKTLRLKIEHVPQHFVLYYLRTRQGRQEIMSRSTGNQESMRNIGQDRIRSIPVPLCSPKEAEEIVRILEEQFSHIGKLEADIETNLKKAEALRQSILKKAFAGELVPQDPSDEPAAVLLERIRAERAEKTPRAASLKPKTRGRKPRTATT